MTNQFQLNENITFSVENNALSHSNGNEVSLDNLENKVLQTLVDSFDNTVSKDDIAKCWITVGNTSDNSISRVISILRGKLNQLDSDSGLVIKSIRKKGYKLTNENKNRQEIALKTSTQQSIEQRQEKKIEAVTFEAYSKPFFNRLPIIYFCCLTLFMITIYGFSSLSSTTSQSTPNYANPYLLFEDTMRKFELSPSERGDFLVYSGQRMGSRQWLLGVYDNQAKILHYIERTETDLTTPTWVSEEMLAMRVKGKDSCWVELISIIDLINNEQGRKITNCYQQSPIFSMTKVSSNELLIADSPAISKGSHLTRVDIHSGASKLISVKNDGGAGVYKDIASPNMKHLALLTTNDWVNTQLDIVSIDDVDTIIWSKHLDFPLFYAAFFDDKISYKSNEGSIITHHFNDDFSVGDTLDVPVFMPFDNVTRFANDLIFSKGELYSQNIFLHDLNSDSSIAISQTKSERNYMPHRVNADEVWYISNKTGISQLWSHQLSNQISRQLSFFKSQLEINSLDISRDGRLVLLGTNNGVQLYSYEQNQVKSLLQTFNGYNPVFFQEKIIFTKMQGSTYELFSHSLNTQNVKQITAHGGYRAKVDGDDLYFDKHNTPGIWKLTDNSETLTLALKYLPKRWLVNDEQLYVINENTISKFDTVSLSNEIFHSSECQQARQINWNSCLNVINDNLPNQIVVLPTR